MIFLVDVDDVLFYSIPSGKNDWRKDIEKDLNISQDSVDNAFLNKTFLSKPWDDVAIGKVGLYEFVNEFLKKVNSKVTPGEFIDYWLYRDNAINDSIAKYFLELKNKGHKLYLATNQERHRMSYLHKNNPILSEIFDCYFTSSSIGNSKPKREFFNFIIEGLDINPNEIVFIDDSTKNIEGARDIGINSILYSGDLEKLKYEVENICKK